MKLCILSWLFVFLLSCAEAQRKQLSGVSIYAIKTTGELLWYKDLDQHGTNGKCGERGWDPNSGKQIYSGFEDVKQLILADNGILYALMNTGKLIFFRDGYQNGRNGDDGSHGWVRGSGSPIGCGWDIKQIVAGANGIIYALKNTGELLWYKDEYQNGDNGLCGEHGWARNSGSQIGCGWDFKQIFSGGNGVIYAIKNSGELIWYKDLYQNGTNGKCGERGWDTNSGKQIGCGWGGFKTIFSGNNGVIFTIKNTGELLWYRDLIKNGNNGKCGDRGWDPNSGNQVGCGWLNFK